MESIEWTFSFVYSIQQQKKYDKSSLLIPNTRQLLHFAFIKN